MADCKACGVWFGTVTPQDLCPTCEKALKRLNGYAAPVVHGEWDDWNGEPLWQECSACNYRVQYSFSKDCNFCPNCGAKMDGERKGDDAAN